MSIKDQNNKYQQIIGKDGDKASEIKRIECEQRLIVERMLRLEVQKERLQNLLDVLQSLDSDQDDDESN
ncbi:unnamed protein product [Adineta steineri]|uniref:Uncharacterized protein n=1 Tax=Adineta steineri TaxID=433720 RepID=A0A814EK05_9BILA|nr:unnamed protein product [Adineta steineri]